MTRGGRVMLAFLFFSTLYLLAFFQVLSLPLVEDKIAEQILPVVSWYFIPTCFDFQTDCHSPFPYFWIHLIWTTICACRIECHIGSCSTPDSMVAPRFLWVVRPLVFRMGFIHISRLSRGIYRIAWGKSAFISVCLQIFVLRFHVESCAMVLLCYSPSRNSMSSAIPRNI